ncbi:hypothetical protein DFH08DRAFT_928153 [Mycena albidolilacea]|uniref:Uncharacterized protein n=1 Tax=Mycena albidolilacea TaxID=1033008 RepID=A0AAD7ATN3_9AGAR|nr:hypothetical protein DFH08DRAFT_928153 [Mycena albidolilacea]
MHPMYPFYGDHVIHDPTLRLLKFQRQYPSLPPITITVTEAADPEFLGKRKGNKQAESLRPAKRKRKAENAGSHDKDERQKTELQNRVPKLIRKAERRSRRLSTQQITPPTALRELCDGESRV